MRPLSVLVIFVLSGCAVGPGVAPDAGTPESRTDGALVLRGIPRVPDEVRERLRRYQNVRRTSLLGWYDGGALIATRFGETAQLHFVEQPGSARHQLTYFDEPVGEVAIPRAGQGPLILGRDAGGSEFYQLFVFDPATGESRIVSDGHSRYSNVLWSPDGQRFAYTTTERNGTSWDLHVQDLAGNRTPVLETDSGAWSTEDWSDDGKRLLVRHYASINRGHGYELDLATGAKTALIDESLEAAFAAPRYDGRGGIFLISDLESEFMRLHHLDRATGRLEVVTGDIPWNIEGLALSPARDRLAFVSNEHGLSRLHVWALPSRKPVALPELPAGIIASLEFRPDGRSLGITQVAATSPADAYEVDLVNRRLLRWTTSELGGLVREDFVAPELVAYESFDEQEIPAFVFRPPGPGPHPVVVLIHGGPESQYRPYFSTTVQALIHELGVAVIAPNVRGSGGYGRSYLLLDNGRLREDSVKDIGALLDWVALQPELDGERVGVMGGSYGGYMVLASLVRYGDRLRAAQEAVGISNFVTFLENTQPYRRDLRRQEYGDERDPEMRAFLHGISPLTHVDAIRTPLLITQGANDPRVPASESDQIADALTASEVPVWYVLALDEGHGFRKKRNRDFADAARLMFFERYLLGDDGRARGDAP